MAKKISETAIRSWVGDRNYDKGLPYFKNNSLFDLRSQGESIRGRCEGTLPNPYRLEVQFSGKEIESGHCSCPVGHGGHCKHIAALLMMWQQKPKEFVEMEDTQTALQNRSKEELIVLIKQMLRQNPELESLLSIPLPGTKSDKPANLEDYRRQAEAIFRETPNEWGAIHLIVESLEGIVDIGDGFLDQKDYLHAAAVYEGVIAAIVDNYYTEQDQEGDLYRVVNDCTSRLETCLKEIPPNTPARQAIFRALWDITSFDIYHGGIGFGDEAPDVLFESATPEEKRIVRNWIQEELDDEESGSDWSKKTLAGFLLHLQEDELSDEEFIKFSRQYGLREAMVTRLLRLERFAEAIKEVEKIDDYRLLHFADLLVQYKQKPAAEKLIREAMKKPNYPNRSPLLEWLKKNAESGGDEKEQLRLLEELFEANPTFERYQELKEKLGESEFSKRQSSILKKLEKKNHYWLLIEIRLSEGNIREAIAVHRKHPGSGYAMKIAQAAEETLPKEAIDLYQTQVEQLIKNMGRENYREAAKYLKRIRELYEGLGTTDQFDLYINSLLEKNKTLRALREEFSKAKLISSGSK